MSANTSILQRSFAANYRLINIQQVLLKRLDKLQHGTLLVRFDDGTEQFLKGSESGQTATINIHQPFALVRALLSAGDLGFAESFIRGDWTSPNLTDLLYLLSVNLEAYDQEQTRSLPVRVLTQFQHLLNRNNITGSRKNIAAHYDLGNDFYARWLDSSMSYSSAVYDHSSDLSEAQQRKYALIMNMIDPEPGDHILEIGCGWGGFAEYAARWGMQVTAVTLSQQQFNYAQQRIQSAGLSDNVHLKLADYRTLRGQYDHIVSIEMFEAVGEAYWPEYFQVLDRCLKPQGRVALQVITIHDELFDTYKKEAGGFIQKYIFPGGMLPTEQHLSTLAWDAGLEPQGIERYGEYYADTLSDWHEAFNQQTDWLEAHGYDEKFRRMWRYYLAFCEAGFKDGRTDLIHLSLQKA